MAETAIRKACDRCHAQKLSCKRDKDKPCERCLRLKTECKSSPSLRYKKNTQQQQQQPLPQRSQHQLESDSAPRGCRSPKRRRTDSDPNLVSPDTVPIVPHTSGLTSGNHLAVTPDPVLEIGNFSFNFDPLGLFSSSQSEYLSHAGVPGCVDQVHHPPQQQHPPLQPSSTFTDSWDPRLVSSDTYPSVPPGPLPPPGDASSQGVVLQEPLLGGCVPEHSSSDKRSRQRTKQRPRQIHLANHIERTTPLIRDAPLIHWMAQLADINARLLDLSSALPSQETACNGPFLGRPTDERFKVAGFPIDEVFKLTRRVADILEQSPPEPSETIDPSDPGNSMFILSIYMRLLDMYQKVFSLVHAELRQTNTNTKFRFWRLPDVTVGSFAVQSSPFLQMSLTVQLAEEFLSRLRRSTSRWSRAPAGSTSMFSGVVDISFQAFKEREEELSKHLVELRSEIEALLDS